MSCRSQRVETCESWYRATVRHYRDAGGPLKHPGTYLGPVRGDGGAVETKDFGKDRGHPSGPPGSHLVPPHPSKAHTTAGSDIGSPLEKHTQIHPSLLPVRNRVYSL